VTTKRKPKSEHKKRGRKKIVATPAMMKKIEELAAAHMTQQQMYRYLRMSHTTWGELVKNNPAIMETVERGKASTFKLAVSKLIEALHKGEAWAIKFYLEFQHQWTQSKEIPAVLPSPDSDKITAIDPVEASKQYQKLMDG
jgi:hypothetical protein